MPALNFQARFAPLVESGEKTQTIRAFRKDGRDPKPGDTLYLFTGMRTKACRKLGEATCADALPIEILTGRCIVLHGGPLAPGYADALAILDGFGSAGEMMDWFEKTHGLPFEGLLIRWDNPQK